MANNNQNNMKLLTLYREAVHNPIPDSETGDNRRLTLTMDYFDALEVKEDFAKDFTIRQFFGQDTKEELREYDVAMHSIPLYRPDNEFTRSFTKENEFYGDPLNDGKNNERKADFLCLIQVYITPEVLRRIDIYRGEVGSTPEAASRAYNFFFEDLHAAMHEYTENCLFEKMEDGSVRCKEASFCYCIYESLSLGDYMIAIRCRKLDYVFQIMEAVRRRRFELNPDTVVSKRKNEPKSLILYKTYTIVSINDFVIPEEDDIAKTLADNNRFILRVVLSNHYWHDEKEVERRFPPDVYLYSTEFKRLHGRYNFSVELSEAAFCSLLPTLKKYKLGLGDVVAKEVELSKREMEICRFLQFLLENDYISQINERYVSGNEYWKDGKIKDVPESVIPFCGLKKKEGYLNKEVWTELQKLKNDIAAIGKRVKQLDTSRTTIAYNMILLKRMLNICSTINGYSDSRVYAVIIVRLIRATLNGMREYLDYLDDTDDYGIIVRIDSELNRSVADLKAFADYILDNSLQSLQTPDYKLESHISVEKLMMSYSAFLQRVIDWYRDTEFAKRIGGMQEHYVTIMVPKAIDNGLSTKTYFYHRDVTSTTKTAQDEITQAEKVQVETARDEKEKLLVVNCPSFDVLTDFAGSLGRLLHELAHNLRYEDRGDRNEMIIRYSAGLLLDQLVVDLTDRIRSDIETIYDGVKLQRLLGKVVKKNFVKYIKDSIPSYRELKLLNLTEKIRICYEQLIDAVLYMGNVKRYIKAFARSEDNSILTDMEVETLWDFYEGFFGEKSESWPETDKERDELFAELAEGQVSLRVWLTKVMEDRLFENGNPKKENRDKNNAYGLLYVLCSAFPDEFAEEYPNYGENQSENEEDNRIDRSREKQFYTICMRAALFVRRVTKDVAEMVNEYQNEPDGRKIARYLAMGYYFVSNRSSIDFMELTQSSLLRTKVDSLKLWEDDLYMYREIASDLFMAKMLGLTPFGYLNFCTEYLPADGKLEKVYVSRIAMTIYAMDANATKDEVEDSYLRWRTIFPAMCRYIESEIRSIREKKKSVQKIIEDLDDFADRMDHYSRLPVSTASGDNMQERADEWSRYLKWFITKVEDEAVIRRLKHCIFLCRTFIQVADFYESEVGKIEWADELSVDLAQGGNALDELHDSLVQSPLWIYCRLIQTGFNEPVDTKELRSNELLPAEMVTKFVLDMHYDMLFNSIDKFA